MPALTLADVLAMPALRQGNPEIVVAESRIDRPVRWVHSTELADVASLLRDGDLVMTTGVHLPSDVDDLRQFAASLAEVGCSGLIVELGRRWHTALPPELVESCESNSLPLIVLQREVRFAAVAQAVGERIVDSQLADLRDAQHVHRTFTELSFTRTTPAEILRAVHDLSGSPVVLENEQHRPLDFITGPSDPEGFLDKWRSRSASVRVAARTGWDEKNGWSVTRLDFDGRTWGRLVIGSPTQPSERLTAVAERAAAALALHRFHDRYRHNVNRRVHHELLELLRDSPMSEEATHRCRLAEFPVENRVFVGVLVRRLDPGGVATIDELLSAIVRAAHGARTPALVCEVDREAHVLLSLPSNVNADTIVDRLGTRLQQLHDVVIAVGRTATNRDDIDESLSEAIQILNAIPEREMTPGLRPAVHRLADLHLRGFLALMADDDHLRLFIDRELAALKKHDSGAQGRRIGALMPVLRAHLDHPASKSDAAASLHLSRAAFYDRLSRIEEVLDVDLTDPAVRVSLHVAMMADEVSRS